MYVYREIDDRVCVFVCESEREFVREREREREKERHLFCLSELDIHSGSLMRIRHILLQI